MKDQDMTQIVNLRTARKARERDSAKARADASAAKHGRTKALKALEKARAAKSARDLDGSRRTAADPPREPPRESPPTEDPRPEDQPAEDPPLQDPAPEDLPPEDPNPEDWPPEDPDPDDWPAARLPAVY